MWELKEWELKKHINKEKKFSSARSPLPHVCSLNPTLHLRFEPFFIKNKTNKHKKTHQKTWLSTLLSQMVLWSLLDGKFLVNMNLLYVKILSTSHEGCLGILRVWAMVLWFPSQWDFMWVFINFPLTNVTISMYVHIFVQLDFTIRSNMYPLGDFALCGIFSLFRV